MKIFGFLLLLLGSIQLSTAQSSCNSPEYRQFDFWIGDWVVYDDQGIHAGDSHIERVLDSCVIQENWTSMYGGHGKSFNAYNPATRQWRQTWIDNKGQYTDFYGAFDTKGGFMRVTALPVLENGKSVIRRMTFTPQHADLVRQHGEISEDNGSNWNTEYDLYYHRRSAVTDLKPLYWLADDWVILRNGERTGTHETWKRVTDSLFRCKGYVITTAGDTVLNETVELSVKDGTLYYTTTVWNQNAGQPVPFRLASQTGNSWTFENPTHDFPQRIHYERIGMDSLSAWIEGRGRKMEYMFVRNSQPEKFVVEDAGEKFTMRKFFLLTYRKGANRSQSAVEAEKIQAEHMAHLNWLYYAGKSCIAGPTDGKGDVRGFVVFNVATLEEAIYLGGLDPAVRSGRLAYDIVPWYAAEGTMMK